MELISKVSKGSRMDQVYIPKKRSGLSIGSYVVIKPLETEKQTDNPIFYGIESLEPVKLEIINAIFQEIDKAAYKYDNVIITGSFLDKGFNFNDIDIVLVTDEKVNTKYIEKLLTNRLGVCPHIILIDNKSLSKGMETDPLYNVMLSKCVSKKRLIYKIKRELKYKLLDLHLLKSKMLPENFDFLTGNEKYYLTRNMIAIKLFINGKRVTKDSTDQEIDRIFGKDSVKNLKLNMIEKGDFMKEYKKEYKKIFESIFKEKTRKVQQTFRS